MKSVQFVSAARRYADEHPLNSGLADNADPADGWRPECCLGAPTEGGLALPAATPTASWLYAPRGVHLGRYRGRDVLVAADTGNHRVLIWHDVPTADEQPCDVVLGQLTVTSEGAAAGSGDTRRGMHLPTGALIWQDRLVIADAWHHRVLIYDGLPDQHGAEPDLVLGQPDLVSVEPNRGGEPAADTMYWPFGIAVVDGRFYVADTGNRRILGWTGGIPESPAEIPDLILGQPGPNERGENRDGPVRGDSFRWPHDVCGTDDRLLVADAGNHRVLGWLPHPTADRPADMVAGQPDFESATEWPYSAQGPTTTRFPYACDADAGRLAIADTANNRILLWDRVPEPDAFGLAAPANAVLGQPDFGSSGENRWSAVTPDSLCWPYGLSLSGHRLAIADSGNNRIVIWRRT